MTKYLSWLAGSTPTQWNNDSAVLAQIERAEAMGAIGCTTNPPLSHEALTTDSTIYAAALAGLDKTLSGDEYAFQAMSLVVAHLSKHFQPMHESRGGFFGCVRAQVAPNQSRDGAAMLEAGKRLAALGGNVMVKIPGTKAGIWALEELVALGIPTNPTVVTTVAQAVAAAEAFERGCARAKQAGIKPAWSSCAIVMGRAQDYFASVNKERGLNLATTDLEWAALAIVKKSYAIYSEKGYASRIMPAAFRAAMQVEQLAGGEFHATIHPKIQDLVDAADAAGTLKREIMIDRPVDSDAVARVMDAMPECRQSLEPDALAPDQFDDFGSVKMTLHGFDVNGWQKLVALRQA